MGIENQIVWLGSDVAELKKEIRALTADLQNFKWEVLKTGLIPVQPKAASEFASVGAELRATVKSVKRSIEA